MVCYCLDLRGDSKLGKFLSSKLVSILVGFIQLGIWLSTLVNLIIQPQAAKEVLRNADTGVFALVIITIVMLVGFSVLLLIGLFKNNKCFLQSYLIFNGAITVLFIVTFFVALFTQPKHVGVGGFFGMLIFISLNILYFFVIRNYLLSLQDQQARNPV